MDKPQGEIDRQNRLGGMLRCYLPEGSIMVLILNCSFSPLTGDGVQYYLPIELSIKLSLRFSGKS
jgi:hypothetical protein